MSRIRKVAKHIIFSLIPLIILCVLAEISIRVVYYQGHSDYPIALIHAFRRVQQIVLVRLAKRKVRAAIQDMGVAQDEIARIEQEAGIMSVNLYSSKWRDMLDYYKTVYRTEFEKFVQEVQNLGAKLLILYIPASHVTSPISNISRSFFQNLAQEYRLDFLDPSEQFAKYPVDWVTLYPEDSHLSRFGNYLVVELVSSSIKQYDNYSVQFHFEKRPVLFGDLKPHTDSIWEMKDRMPSRTTTNSQGLRMEYDLTFPKTKQRILLLGDSFTFGPYLHNQDTYPAILDRTYPDKEVINAGVCGYTIRDELWLFTEKAKYVEPDIVILQVCPNDLPELSYFIRRILPNRNLGDKIIEPSAREIELLKTLSSEKSRN